MAYQLVKLGGGTFGAYDPTSQQARSFSSEPLAKQFFGTQQIDYSKAIDPTFDVSKVLGTNADKLVSFAPPAPGTQPVTLGVPKAVPTPTFADPTAPDTHETFINSNTETLDTQRKALEDAYKKQIEEIRLQKEEAQKEIDTLTTKETETIEGPVKEALTPFRDVIEQRERNRLQVEQNFTSNQKLINELDGLLTESNQIMAKMKEQKVPGLAGLQQSPRMVNALNNIAARVGVINSVMAARNNQISVAENMIDRSLEAMNADKRDQLNYYNTLLNFFDNQRDEQGEKLINLDKQEQGFLGAQIGLLENDLARSQETADYIKKLMISPDTAKFMADAGITLNDSVETIQKKMAFQADIQIRQEEAKANMEEAFAAGIEDPYYNKEGLIVRTSDGWGFKNEEEFKDMTGMTLQQAEAAGLVGNLDIDVVASKNQVLALMEKYWDAGIKPSDSIDIATSKALRSGIYLDAIRGPVGSGSGEGEIGGIGLYNSTVDEALMQGATPEEAVFAAISLAGTLGTKLDAKDQKALLEYARSRQSTVAPAAGGDQPQVAPVKVTAREFGRELPGAIGKVVAAPVKASKKVLDVTADTLIGAAEGIGNFFK